jgi:hypothetical protein
MPHNIIKICAAVLVFVAMTVGQVQAQGKGTSGFAPGRQFVTAGSGDPGKSSNAPGDVKHDSTTPLKNAKTLAPGHKK